MSIPVNRMSTGSMYAVANRRVVSHAVPMVGYLKGAPLRSPLDLSFAFASEQTIDELAVAAKLDPLEFRRKNIGDQRWLGVLNAAAAAAGWTPKVSGSSLSSAEVVTGRGIGLGTHHVSYGAAVADIEVNQRTGNIVAKRVYARARRRPDHQSGAGREPDRRTVDPGGEPHAQGGGAPSTRTASPASTGCRIRCCASPSIPDVVPVVVQRLDEPSTGAGEEVMGATTAAIANAFFDATGVRLRQYPMTPERVKAALAART